MKYGDDYFVYFLFFLAMTLPIARELAEHGIR
jgi:hypothetical protein